MRKLLAILSILIPLLVACSDDSTTNLPTPIYRLDLATVTATEPVTALEVYDASGRNAIPLSTSQHLEGVVDGQRILIYYASEVADTVLRPVPVTLISAGAIPYGPVEPITKQQIDTSRLVHYDIESQWLTGPWLNFRLTVRMVEGTTFRLVADAATLNNDIVDLWFVGTNLPGDTNAYLDQSGYASYDVTTVIKRPDQTYKINH